MSENLSFARAFYKIIKYNMNKIVDLFDIVIYSI